MLARFQTSPSVCGFSVGTHRKLRKSYLINRYCITSALDFQPFSASFTSYARIETLFFPTARESKPSAKTHTIHSSTHLWCCHLHRISDLRHRATLRLFDSVSQHRTFVCAIRMGRAHPLDRKLGWHRTALDVPILLFLGLGLIASFLAPHPDTSSLGYFWKHLRAVLLFYAVLHSQLGIRWRHIVIAFIAAAGISSGLGLWYYANDTRLAIDFMGKIGLQFQEELAVGEGPHLQISDELRSELRNCNVPLSQTVTFVASKQPDEWRIDDPARNRRYIVRKRETHLRVYMIEQRSDGNL